ncbi:hypothetical protein, partial [Pseudomonas sp. 2822-17]|uniref:hypothetical protein n=1 Tax=Pseudomonas sp. 2822-17 TaxID=1712678 RepID=UPI001C479CAA
IALGIMMSIVLLYQWMFTTWDSTRLIHSFLSISAAIIGGVIYIVLIWLLRVFEKNEWESLPKVAKMLPYR